MTLSTDIYIHGTGVTQREVYDKVNELLDIPAVREVIDAPCESDWNQGDWQLSNQIGQGFPAIVDTYAMRDGSEIVPAHDDDCARWAVEDGEPCTSPRHIVPPYHVHVDLDTSYGYRDTRGWGCAQLHGWVVAALIDWLTDRGCTVVAALIDWLTDRGCTLHWVDEYAGTLHEGKDHLEAFLGHGAEATAWFNGVARPAILADATNRAGAR